jgi:hypothetical protein
VTRAVLEFISAQLQGREQPANVSDVRGSITVILNSCLVGLPEMWRAKGLIKRRAGRAFLS